MKIVIAILVLNLGQWSDGFPISSTAKGNVELKRTKEQSPTTVVVVDLGINSTTKGVNGADGYRGSANSTSYTGVPYGLNHAQVDRSTIRNNDSEFEVGSVEDRIENADVENETSTSTTTKNGVNGVYNSYRSKEENIEASEPSENATATKTVSVREQQGKEVEELSQMKNTLVSTKGSSTTEIKEDLTVGDVNKTSTKQESSQIEHNLDVFGGTLNIFVDFLKQLSGAEKQLSKIDNDIGANRVTSNAANMTEFNFDKDLLEHTERDLSTIVSDLRTAAERTALRHGYNTNTTIDAGESKNHTHQVPTTKNNVDDIGSALKKLVDLLELTEKDVVNPGESTTADKTTEAYIHRTRTEDIGQLEKQKHTIHELTTTINNASDIEYQFGFHVTGWASGALNISLRFEHTQQENTTTANVVGGLRVGDTGERIEEDDGHGNNSSGSIQVDRYDNNKTGSIDTSTSENKQQELSTTIHILEDFGTTTERTSEVDRYGDNTTGTIDISTPEYNKKEHSTTIHILDGLGTTTERTIKVDMYGDNTTDTIDKSTPDHNKKESSTTIHILDDLDTTTKRTIEEDRYGNNTTGTIDIRTPDHNKQEPSTTIHILDDLGTNTETTIKIDTYGDNTTGTTDISTKEQNKQELSTTKHLLGGLGITTESTIEVDEHSDNTTGTIDIDIPEHNKHNKQEVSQTVLTTERIPDVDGSGDDDDDSDDDGSGDVKGMNATKYDVMV